jgi:hypothetical protein
VYCRANATRRDGNVTRCGWYVLEELLVLEGWIQSQPRNDDLHNFIITCRPERSRELLIFPRPTAGNLAQYKFDITHLRNMEVIRRVNTWKAIAKVVKQLENKTGIAQPVELIALNFGAWETQLSKDPEADDCHAHIHVVLTKEAAIAAGKVPEMAPFKGREADPVSYLSKDCDQLELHRLVADEMGTLRDDMGTMRGEMGTLRDEVRTLREDVSTRFTSLETRFTSLETTLAVREDRFTSVETTLAEILARLPAPATQAATSHGQ